MASEKSIKYISKFNKEHYRNVLVRFRIDDPEDSELLKKIEAQESMQGFIKDILKEALIKKD